MYRIHRKTETYCSLSSLTVAIAWWERCSHLMACALSRPLDFNHTGDSGNGSKTKNKAAKRKIQKLNTITKFTYIYFTSFVAQSANKLWFRASIYYNYKITPFWWYKYYIYLNVSIRFEFIPHITPIFKLTIFFVLPYNILLSEPIYLPIFFLSKGSACNVSCVIETWHVLLDLSLVMRIY